MVKIGDLELDNIYNMDCREGLKKLPNESVDAIITDIPYNTKLKPHKPDRDVKFGGSFFNDCFTDEEYGDLITFAFREGYRVLKNNRMGYCFISWRNIGQVMDIIKGVGFEIKNVIVWDKKNHGLNYQNYAYTHEFIIFFKKGKAFPNNKDVEDKKNLYYQDVWRIPRDNFTSFYKTHPTLKPLKLMRVMVRHITDVGDIVLDMFAGSGSTLVASKELERHYIGFEIEKKYYNVAIERLNKTEISINKWFEG